VTLTVIAINVTTMKTVILSAAKDLAGLAHEGRSFAALRMTIVGEGAWAA
jgi:hypothetical protein